MVKLPNPPSTQFVTGNKLDEAIEVSKYGTTLMNVHGHIGISQRKYFSH